MLNLCLERFPHKPYINIGYPKNATVVVNSTATFKCPIVSDLEPFMQWVRVDEKPSEQNNTLNGTLLQVHVHCRQLWWKVLGIVVPLSVHFVNRQ